MAKGDREQVGKSIDFYGNSGFGQTNRMMPQFQNQYNQMANNYNQAWGQGMGNYNNIMQGYSNFLNGGAMGPGSGYSNNQQSTPRPSLPTYNGNMQQFDASNAGLSGIQFPMGQSGPSSGGSSGGGGDALGYFSSKYPAGSSLSPQMLLANEADLNAHGIKLIKNAEGQPGKIQLADGSAYDVIQGAGSGQNLAQLNKIAGPGGVPLDSGGGGGYPGAIGNALSGYGNFAMTGGFSPQDIEDMRARNVASTRAAFQQGQDDLSRERALAGGNMPNYAAAQAKMTREEANNVADVNTNTNAGLVQLIQQGKLAGLGGLSQTGLLGQGQNLAALQGMTGLYGTAPGAAGLAQSGMLNSGNQQQNLQQMANSMGLGLIGSNMQATQIPSGWQQFLQTWGPIIAGAAMAL